MANNFSRPLNTNILAGEFLENVLDYSQADLDQKADEIVSAELKIRTIDNKTTLLYEDYRHTQYRSTNDRKKLRNQIITELLTFKRLENDENIKLGDGGCLPRVKNIKAEKNAYLIIGLPASGKSGIANTIADKTGSLILDSDYTKRKIPEFAKDNGASLVHEESSMLILGSKLDPTFPCIYNYCEDKNFNIVVPKIGHDKVSVEKLAEKFKNDGYKVHLILVSLDRKKATLRALKRFIDTGRYVPLSLIFDVYSNDPILTYYRIKDSKIFSSYGKLSTDVVLGKNAIVKDGVLDSPVNFFK